MKRPGADGQEKRLSEPSGRSAPLAGPCAPNVHTLLIDAHTHLYEDYGDDRFFDSALANLEAAATQLAVAGDWWGCLLFSETPRDNAFERLRERAASRDGSRWSFRRTDEDESLIAAVEDQDRLIVVAGRQICTAEGLEVLALCCRAEFQDGLPFDVTLDRVRERGAVAVLPWGFGKWWFARARVMRRVLRWREARSLYLGDNGGRPAVFPDPPLFKFAHRLGILVLPGSDTLPLASEAARVARYGFLVRGGLDITRPARGVRALLEAQTTPPRIFGRREGLASFARQQTALRLRRRGNADARGRSGRARTD